MEDIIVPPNYSNRKQHENLIANLKEFYMQSTLCDVTLVVGNKEVACHKVVLASSSPYFMAMFTTNLCEKSQETVTLHSIDERTFPSIIEYMYTAVIKVHNNNVQSLFSTANLLQMNDLCNICAEHMQNEIHVTNCVNLYRFAAFHHAESLKTAAKTFILNHFKELNTSEELMSVDVDELLELLGDDNLNVDDECIVFSTVIQWLNTDFESRKEHIDSLFKIVRFSLIEPDMVESLMTSLECFRNGAILSQCLLEMNQYTTPRNVNYRLGMYDREMIVFAGGSQTKTTRSLACYDPITKRNYYAIQPYLSFDFKYRIDHHKLITTDNNSVFLVGGIYYDVYHYEEIGPALSEVKMFEPHTKSWEMMASLLRPRCAHSCVTKGNKIFVFGGKSHYPRGEPLDSAEAYDIVANCWESLPPMPAAVAHHGSVYHNKHAYVLGGYKNNENSDVSNDIYQFDTELYKWVNIPTKLQIPRGEFGITLLKDDVYIIGGDRGQYKISYVEVLNLGNFRIRFAGDFPEDRKSMSAVTFKDKIYVIGGVRTIISRMNRGPRVVETRDLWSFDESKNMWHKEAKLVQYANIHGCSVATLNLRRLCESEFISSV